LMCPGCLNRATRHGSRAGLLRRRAERAIGRRSPVPAPGTPMAFASTSSRGHGLRARLIYVTPSQPVPAGVPMKPRAPSRAARGRPTPARGVSDDYDSDPLLLHAPDSVPHGLDVRLRHLLRDVQQAPHAGAAPRVPDPAARLWRERACRCGARPTCIRSHRPSWRLRTSSARGQTTIVRSAASRAVY